MGKCTQILLYGFGSRFGLTTLKEVHFLIPALLLSSYVRVVTPAPGEWLQMKPADQSERNTSGKQQEQSASVVVASACAA
jgi:hypothetical protein